MKTIAIFTLLLSTSILGVLKYSHLERSFYRLQTENMKDKQVISELKELIGDLTHCEAGEYCKFALEMADKINSKQSGVRK